MSKPAVDRPHSFAQRIARLKQGEHLCSVYAEKAEMLTQAVPYIKAGLLNGERCIYVADENEKETLLQAMRFWGIDVDSDMNSRRLLFWTRHDYRQPGLFDLDTMLAFVRRTLHQAMADGYNGIRLAVEMSWTINSGISDDDLVRWEDFINTISSPGTKVSFICQYNRQLLPPSLIAKAVHVHPVVVLGQDICPNRFCRPAVEVLSSHEHPDLDSVLATLSPASC
jgi:hypothetical protein